MLECRDVVHQQNRPVFPVSSRPLAGLVAALLGTALWSIFGAVYQFPAKLAALLPVAGLTPMPAALLVLAGFAGSLVLLGNWTWPRLCLVVAAGPLLRHGLTHDPEALLVLALAFVATNPRLGGRPRLSGLLAGIAAGLGWTGILVAPYLFLVDASKRRRLVFGGAALTVGAARSGLGLSNAGPGADAVLRIPNLWALFTVEPGPVGAGLAVLAGMAVLFFLARRTRPGPADEGGAEVLGVAASLLIGVLATAVPPTAVMAILVPLARQRSTARRTLVGVSLLLVASLDWSHAWHRDLVFGAAPDGGHALAAWAWTPYVLYSIALKVGLLLTFMRRDRQVRTPTRPASAGTLSPWLTTATLLLMTGAGLALSLYQLGDHHFPVKGVGTDGHFEFAWSEARPARGVWLLGYGGVETYEVRCESTGEVARKTLGLYDDFTWRLVVLRQPCAHGLALDTMFRPGGGLLEILVADADLKRIPVTPDCWSHGSCDGRAATLVDEQDHLETPGRMTSASADEAFNMGPGIAVLTGRSGGGLTSAHPYFGRMLILFSMRTLGISPFSWRLPAALLGAALPLVVFAFVLTLTGSAMAGLFGAGLALVDPLRLTMSRTAFVDCGVTVWMLLALTAGYKAAWSEVRGPWARLGWIVVAALALVLAGASKWYGFFVLPVLVPTLAVAGRRVWREVPHRGGAVVVLGLAVALAVALYGAAYAPFLTTAGGDGMLQVLRHQLRILHIHTNVAGQSMFEARFASWISAEVTTRFAFIPAAPDRVDAQFALLNPLLCWSILPAAFLLLLGRRKPATVYAVAGFASYVLPWFFIARTSYLYHFLPGAMLGCVIVATRWAEAARLERRIWSVVAGLAAVFFLGVAPIAAGRVLSIQRLETWRLFPSWLPELDDVHFFPP